MNSYQLPTLEWLVYGKVTDERGIYDGKDCFCALVGQTVSIEIKECPSTSLLYCGAMIIEIAMNDFSQPKSSFEE